MTCVFVQIRCRPGTAYKVADAIALREIHSELYSTSGEYDLLMKRGISPRSRTPARERITPAN